jgi:hypothetical protein
MSTLTPGGLLKNLGSGGSVYDATIFGAPAYVNPLIRCKDTKCMEFFGTNEYLSLANPISGLAAFTLIQWVNMDNANSAIYSRATAAGSYALIYTGAGVARCSFYMAGSGYNTAAKRAMTFGQTYMLAWTRDAAESRIHTNGELMVRTTLGASPVDANAFIGQYWDASLRLNGRLDNWMAWNIALTPEQIWSIKRSAEPRV